MEMKCLLIAISGFTPVQTTQPLREPAEVTSVRQTEQRERGHLGKLEVAVDEGPLQELLAGGHAHFVLFVHEDLVEVAVLDLLPC